MCVHLSKIYSKVSEEFSLKNQKLYKECIGSPSFLAVFGGCYFFVIVCKELNNAQTAQINQLFQLLNLICAYGDVFFIFFYGLTCMLTPKM